MTILDEAKRGTDAPDLDERWDALRGRARALRKSLPELAAKADAENADVTEGMRRLWQEGLFDLAVPVRFGGLGTGSPTFQTERYFEIVLDAMAGDSSVGMNYVVQTLVSYEIFDEHNGLPEETKAEMARRVRDEGIRFVASNSETGSPAPVTARRVDGGIIVNGVKTFNTNSGGRGIANVGIMPGNFEGETGRWHALVPLDQPNVTLHGDWDVMGQRGTQSQKITYDEVFVPDGYYFGGHSQPGPFLPFVFLLHSAIMLGAGYGALDAACDYVRKMDRGSLPEFKTAEEDPLIRRRIGEYTAELEAARAFLLQNARKVEGMAADAADVIEEFVEALAVKVACVKAALHVTSDMFELTGARSTSAKYRFDRFWRNARTFATHDPTEAKEVWLGDWTLTGKEPPFLAQLRV